MLVGCLKLAIHTARTAGVTKTSSMLDAVGGVIADFGTRSQTWCERSSASLPKRLTISEYSGTTHSSKILSRWLVGSWYTRNSMQPADAAILESPIAYLSAEFGFDPALPIYAGGQVFYLATPWSRLRTRIYPSLALDCSIAVNMRQTIPSWRAGGRTVAIWSSSSGSRHVYIDGDQPLFYFCTNCYWNSLASLLEKTFSEQTILYLLDSDTDQNPPHLRKITQFLYAGVLIIS